MHFEVLVEDKSGKEALDIILPKLISEGDTFKVHSYNGIGHIPKGLNPKGDPKKRILLTRLPVLLSGYGKVFTKYTKDYPATVVVVCDLDDKDLKVFLSDLQKIENACELAPMTRFCIAVEEGESWLLGDIPAIKKAYPSANNSVLASYKNDAICGTWELLADAIYRGGVKALKNKGRIEVGKMKSEWAKFICPNMDAENNKSPSFNYFKSSIRDLAG